MTSVLEATRALGRSNDKYQYSSLPSDGTVRLLTLLPGRRGSDIHIELDNALLDNNPKYEALSYEWGLPPAKVPDDHDTLSNSFWNLDVTIQLQEQVYCRGKALGITKHLHAILNHLRSNDRRRLLWIDGICINQEDIIERREQILLMRRIYEQAAKVLMWIGEAKPGSERAFEIVKHLAKGYDDQRPDTDRKSKGRGRLEKIIINERDLGDLQGDCRPAIEDVLTRSYFSRVWVVQEIVMSTTADVLCGTCTVPWLDLYKAIVVIIRLGLFVDRDPHQLPLEAQAPNSHDVVQLKSAMEESNHNSRLWAWTAGICQVWKSRYRSVHGGKKSYPFAALGTFLLSHEVTDSRDRIYGMLGMVNPESAYGRDHPIQPNYTKTVEEVYQDACQWSIRDSGSLAMLDLCDAPATNKLKKLPTWVPDFTSGVRKCRLLADIKREADAIDGWLFTPLSTYFGNQFRVSFKQGNNVLNVRGLVIDTVSAATLNCTSKSIIVITMGAFQDFCLDTGPYPTGGTRLGAVWRTLLTNYVTGGPLGQDFIEAPAILGEHFIADITGKFRHQLGLPDTLTGNMPDINTLSEHGIWTLHKMYREDVEANISILALMAKHPFIRYLYDNAHVGDAQAWRKEFSNREYIAYGDEGRQFVVTEKGYMGLGPRCPPLRYGRNKIVVQQGSYVKKGDVVAVLAGSDKVWYLRREVDGGPYRIVGHGYVHGVTEGRWFDMDMLPVMEDIELC
jgi:hypothetical protein